MLKNQERSQLHKEYNFQVVKYNEYIERIIKTKFEMSFLWKYKKDYPADWKRLAEKLSCDRRDSELLKRNIVSIKGMMRQSNSEFNQK